MTHNEVTIIIALLGLIGAFIAFLIKESKDAGRRESKLDKLLDDVALLKNDLRDIPALKVKIVQLENQYDTVRSDIKELLREKRNSQSWEEDP